MEQYKQEFIEFMVDSQVLKFGEFTLKSGRKSPFFMNAGGYVTGSQLKKLGEYYAKAIHAKYGEDFDVLFGPAYKGIPLSVVTAIAFSELYGKEIRSAYRNSRRTCQSFHYFAVILGTFSTYIDNNLCIILFQKWNVSFAEKINSRVLKSNCIQHTTGSLCHSRCRISRPRHVCNAFCHNTAKFVQIYKF